MLSLRDMQLGFAAAVRDTQAAEVFGRHVRNGRLDRVRRLQVYRNNHYAALTGALEAVYPAVLRLTGEDFFRYAARAYAATRPSFSGDIHRYGRHFGNYLAELPQTAAHPYLADVARLEWAYHAAFHAALSTPLDIETLRSVDAADYSRLAFAFQPSARLMESPFPVIDLWRANRAPAVSDATVNLDAGSDRLLVLREREEVAIYPLPASEYALLQVLRRGLNLGNALEIAAHYEAGFDLGAALRRHAVIGTFTGWRLQHG